MDLVGDILWWILLAFEVAVFARIIITWLPVKWPRPLRPLVGFVFDITEPLLSRLRRLVPMIPLGSGMALDLSPMVLLVAVWFLQWVVRMVFG